VQVEAMKDLQEFAKTVDLTETFKFVEVRASIACTRWGSLGDGCLGKRGVPGYPSLTPSPMPMPHRPS
jgi:hypothetical protein